MTFQIILNPRDARTSLNINNIAKVVHKYRTTIAHALSRVALHNIHNYGTSIYDIFQILNVSVGVRK